MNYPDFKTVKRLADSGDYATVPMAVEMLSDCHTPITVLKALKNVSTHVFLLESAEADRQWGRYSFLGYDPTLCITCRNGRMTLDAGSKMTVDTDHPGKTIRQIIADNRCPRVPGMPPFTGGLVGYFAYDYIKYSEPALRLDAEDSEGFNDVDLMLFDKVIAFDHLRQRIVCIANIKTGQLETAYNKGLRTLQDMVDLVQNGKPKVEEPGRRTGDFVPLFDQEAYCEMVEKVKRHIYEGDIFQAVPSNRLAAPFTGSLLGTYRALRATNPSPYMFYFVSDDLEIAGASPETLGKLTDGVLHTFPLAGTKPRGKDREEDERLTAELLTDEKELAEHNMLVDLGRNDIGKLSRFGTVAVEKYHEIEKFSHVMHIGSTVRGEIREDKDALDAVDAILPAGTLSGAPKLKACQIINDLENCKRGIYGGAIGYIDFTGNLDTCIGIRLAYKKKDTVYIRSGAGIVADSVPENEFRECINKAQAVVDAIALAQEEAL